jgi:hypothetical protein
VREHTARGVSFRRAGVVSEPLADFTRFEYESASFNVAAGVSAFERVWQRAVPHDEYRPA